MHCRKKIVLYSFCKRWIHSTHQISINNRQYIPTTNQQEKYKSIINEIMCERIERNPTNLAILESIDFDDSFESLINESPRGNEAKINLEDLDEICFDSFESDDEIFNDNESELKEFQKLLTSMPSQSTKQISETILRPSQFINKRVATSPIKGAISSNTKKPLLDKTPVDLRDIENKDFEGELVVEKLTQEFEEKIIETCNIPDSNKIPSIASKDYFMKPINSSRNFSTTTNNKAKNENPQYYSIQLSTQKPMKSTSEIDFQTSSSLIKNVKPLILSNEQERVLKLAMRGVSLFYTGSAGTGKSVLLKAIIKSLRAKYKPGEVAVTASTGLAACNIGGNTLHSFSGAGLAHGEVSQLIKKIRKNKKAIQRWNEVKVLVIDEISMIDGHFFNKLNEIAKIIRKSKIAFGGIQLVVCGDFYQLPPVVKKTAPDGTEIEKPMDPMFAFESGAWKESISSTIILKEVFRQKGDQKFINMLNELRDGRVSSETEIEFERLSRVIPGSNGIVPAELFATRKEVDRSNNMRLSKIEGEAQMFTAVDAGTLPNPQKQNLLANFLAPQQLFLKKHAQVMCIKNFDETLVNGSLGQVVDFLDRDTYMKMNPNKEESNSVAGSGNDIDKDFELESDFVFDKIKKKNKKTRAETENEKRKEQLAKEFECNSNGRMYPLVRFLLPDGVNTRTLLVEPEQWTVEDEHQKVLLSRTQLPLILAWSLSIHKSQGQTLPKVKVDLRNVFETGQSYVALSRAVSRSGLQVLNFDKFKVKAHPKVIRFYNTLTSADEISHDIRSMINFKLDEEKSEFKI